MGDVSLRILHAPKEGNSEDQYEDAFATSALDDAGGFTVALADGASSAVFARQWANLLVTTVVKPESPFPDSDEAAAAAVAELGKSWRREVESKATSWYAQEKMPNGSSAALLVVTWNLTDRSFTARSVGDACLFLVRGDKLRYAFPMTKSARFTDRPALLSTECGTVPPKILRFANGYEAGDRFLLMTDALAAYFLSERESGRKPWNDLPRLETQLAGWLKTRRDSGKLKNDDVTLIDATL